MLSLLQDCKNWYLDGTFHVVKPPFTQLYSIHGFVKSGDSVKQLPLVFILMSGKKSKDYKKVLSALKDLLPREPSVCTATMDYEAAIWKAIRDVFPAVKVRGCAFHWSQALWRKAQALGLQEAYRTHQPTHRFIRQLLAIQFLPHEHIQPTFDRLQVKAEGQRLSFLCEKVDRKSPKKIFFAC